MPSRLGIVVMVVAGGLLGAVSSALDWMLWQNVVAGFLFIGPVGLLVMTRDRRG